MLYLYDNAIVNDLEKSFNQDIDNPVVRVVSPEQAVAVAAQLKEDQINFPIVALDRHDPVSIDSNRYNFTRAMDGVSAVFDTDKNNFYKERAIPINLSYTLTVLTTNQADLDEINRELIFKYTSMYFLKIRIPYESKREITFGIIIDNDDGISQQSGSSDYSENGTLYQSSLTLDCEGCVLVSYTPVHLKRTVYDIQAK